MSIHKEAISDLCPIRYALNLVGGKWKIPLLCMLSGEEPVRYSVLKRRLSGITNMMLSQSLKDLEEAGMVHREQFHEVPPHVEYSLTEKGQSILPIVVELGQWGANAMEDEKTGNVHCLTCQNTN